MRAQKIINTAAGKVRVENFEDRKIRHEEHEYRQEAKILLNGEHIGHLLAVYTRNSKVEYWISVPSEERICPTLDKKIVWDLIKEWGDNYTPRPAPLPILEPSEPSEPSEPTAYKQPRKADYIEFIENNGVIWNKKLWLCLEEAEYDPEGDIINWYAGETYEGATLRNVPSGVPLQLDIRDEHGDKVDDFCIVIDPTSGKVRDAWSETDTRVHEILISKGLYWDTIPEPSEPASPEPICADRILDMIWNGEIKGDMDHPYGEPGCRLWQIGDIEVYELRDDSGSLYGYGAYDEEQGYYETLLKYAFNRRDALRCTLVKVTSED